MQGIICLTFIYVIIKLQERLEPFLQRHTQLPDHNVRWEKTGGKKNKDKK